MAHQSTLGRPSDVSPERLEHHTLIDHKREYDSLDEIHDRHRPRWQKWRRFANVVRASLEIVLCILLFVNLTGRSTKSLLLKKDQHDWGALHETNFGINNEYMSLDHKYDSLWADEESAYKALVQTNPDDTDTEAQWGAVAMYVRSSDTSMFCH